MSDTPTTVAAWFEYPDVFSTCLVALITDEYGTEALNWHPETIRRAIENDFGAKLSSHNFDKLMGGIAAVVTDGFYGDLPRFVVICQALVGNGVSPDFNDPPDAKEIAWAITEGMMLNPPENDEPFSVDIRAYIAAVLKNEGFASPPDVLRLALGGGDMTARIAKNLAHDPDTHRSVINRQREKNQDVQKMISENLNELVQQIQSLPLQHGNVDDMLKRLPADLKNTK